MATQKMNGIMVNGSSSKAGLTFYTRSGKTVVRVAHSEQPKRRTRAQFDLRMRMKHTIALWHGLRPCNPMFVGGKNVFSTYASLANRLPVVYIGRDSSSNTSLLMPGIPVSAGTLPPMKLRLGNINGTPALMTDMDASKLIRGDKFKLYTLRQEGGMDNPTVTFTVRDVPRSEFRHPKGTLVLVGEAFADNKAGWALVHYNGDRCSTQTVVTRCNFYKRFTSEAAMNAAVATYGGFTE